MEKVNEVSLEQWKQVNPINVRMVEDFLKQSKQLSPQTLKQYTSALRIYFWWVKENADNKSFSELKARNYLSYQNYLSDLGLSSSAIKLKRSAVSSFNSYIEVYYLDEYPSFRNYITKAIANPTPQFVNEKEPLTMDEYNKLCDELEKQELWLQLAYVKFSFSSGARRAEVRQLLKEVIFYEPRISSNGSATYMTHDIRCKGKGVQGKVRKLQFGQDAMDSIKKWLSVRGEDECPYVFAMKKKDGYQQVGETTFNSWSDSYFEPIVGRRFHPHLLRESRATSLVVENGKDINVAQKLLGHQSSQTTEIYVIRKDKDEADDAF